MLLWNYVMLLDVKMLPSYYLGRIENIPLCDLESVSIYLLSLAF